MIASEVDWENPVRSGAGVVLAVCPASLGSAPPENPNRESGPSRRLPPRLGSEPYARPAAAIVDELNAGAFQSATQGNVVCRSERNRLFSRFSAPYRIHSKSRMARKIAGAPAQKGTPGSNLRARKTPRACP
jgi:hypothetical protein